MDTSTKRGVVLCQPGARFRRLVARRAAERRSLRTPSRRAVRGRPPTVAVAPPARAAERILAGPRQRSHEPDQLPTRSVHGPAVGSCDRYEILERRVWNDSEASDANLVRNFIKKLRAKISENAASLIWVGACVAWATACRGRAGTDIRALPVLARAAATLRQWPMPFPERSAPAAGFPTTCRASAVRVNRPPLPACLLESSRTAPIGWVQRPGILLECENSGDKVMLLKRQVRQDARNFTKLPLGAGATAAPRSRDWCLYIHAGIEADA